MRIKVTAPFRDKLAPARLFRPGEVVEFSDERGRNIVALSLGEELAPEKPAAAPKPRKPKSK